MRRLQLFRSVARLTLSLFTTEFGWKSNQGEIYIVPPHEERKRIVLQGTLKF